MKPHYGLTFVFIAGLYYTECLFPCTPLCSLSWFSQFGSQMANGPASDVSTRRKGITHRGIILSIFIFIMSLRLSLSVSIYLSIRPNQFLFFASFLKSPRLNEPNPASPLTPPIDAHSNNRCPRSACASVEMSSATFACILTGRDGVDAQCLPDSLIHQLSPGRSQQNEEGGGHKGKRECMGKIKRVKGES